MKKKDILNQSLPKWPALLVVGKPVTQEQAWEIIIRTTNFSYLSTNDHQFRAEIMKVAFNLPSLPKPEHWSLSNYFGRDWTKANESWESLKVKIKSIADHLSYLGNDQICSSWIGGAHGWCDWHGRIFTNNYNIGKWPSCDAVYHEWKRIAETFPFLDLRAQLLSGETCEEGNNPVIEFRVKDGKATVSKPKKMLSEPSEPSAADFALRFANPQGERGCSLDVFKRAFYHTVSKYSSENK